jgi:fatty-acyl-CoA synthase
MTERLVASGNTPTAGAVASTVFRSELNPVDFLRRAAYMYPGRTAVVDGERRYSYGQLAERSWRLANALRSAGLRKGDRVATLLFNSSPMLEAHFGVPAKGGIPRGDQQSAGWPRGRAHLTHSGARFLLLDGELEPLIAPLELSDVTGGRFNRLRAGQLNRIPPCLPSEVFRACFVAHGIV